MSKPNKRKNIVMVHDVYPLTREECAPGQITLAEMKKYASGRPLRRPAPRNQPEEGDQKPQSS